MADLRLQLLAYLADDRFDSPTEVRLATVLRTVVEPHKPSPGGRWDVLCLKCPAPTLHPCDELKAIARELGVQENGR